MSKQMNRKLFSKRSIAVLLILTVVLAACESVTDSGVLAPSGLGVVEAKGIIDPVNDDINEITGQGNSDVADILGEAGAVTESDTINAQVETSGDAVGNGIGTEPVFDPSASTALSTLEAEGLAYMREEEKLARDVYLALYEQWGSPVFQNIASSEQAHMDSVLMLLEQYGLPDPAAGNSAGEFTNPVFDSLYAQLVEQGGRSLADALAVGGAIEELDILDLEERINQSDEGAIIQVYNNLLAGSENHLRAFASNIERQTGEPYESTYLSQEAYEAIMTGSSGQGNGYGRSGTGTANGNGNNGSRGSGGNGYGNGNGRQNGNGRGNG